MSAISVFVAHGAQRMYSRHSGRRPQILTVFMRSMVRRGLISISLQLCLVGSAAGFSTGNRACDSRTCLVSSMAARPSGRLQKQLQEEQQQ